MNVSRIVKRLPKLWATIGGLRNCLVETPLRSISTGKEYRRFSNESRTLDKFVGVWVEEKRKNEDKVFEAAGLSGHTKQFYANNKVIFSFNKIGGDKIAVEMGVVGQPIRHAFHFKPGQPFESKNLDGSTLKSMVHIQGDKIKGKHENAGLHKYTIERISEVHGNTMTAKTIVKGIEMESVFKKL